jgi:hypothetical protein
MKILKSAIRSCPPFVTWFGVGSLLLLLIQVLWFDTIPEIFPQASAIGTVVEALLGANVAAYIFFVISYQLPQVIERNRVGPTIADLVDRVANGVMGFLQMIQGSTGGGLLNPSEVDSKQVEIIFAKVRPSDPAPMARSALDPTLSWIGAMALHDEQCVNNIVRVWRFSRFLDSELVALLNEIEFSRHSAGMKDVREYHLRPGMQNTNSNLLAWADNYWECYESARRLAQYSLKFRSILISD